MNRFIYPLLATLLAAPAFAQVTITEPWVRATVPMQKATGAFMQLSSRQHVRLVEVTSPLAESVEIHDMSMDDNVMKMRAVHSLDLPAGKRIELKPGGYHVMLLGLKKQVSEGDLVPVTLTFEAADSKRVSVDLKIPVHAINSMPAQHPAAR